MKEDLTEIFEGNPSEVTNHPWIHAFREKGSYFNPTENSGKWLIFTHVDEIDELWSKIKKTTQEGKLGGSSKVATAYESDYNPETKVICVYTYDYTDEEDVMRIRKEIQKLGINKSIPYKTDKDTINGIKGSTYFK